MRIQRALISVSDRRGLVSFVEKLMSLGIICYGTMGTRDYLASCDISIESIDSYARDGGFIGGRVKTLSVVIVSGRHCPGFNHVPVHSFQCAY